MIIHAMKHVDIPSQYLIEDNYGVNRRGQCNFSFFVGFIISRLKSIMILLLFYLKTSQYLGIPLQYFLG